MTRISELRERRSARAKELYDLLEANPGDKWTAELQARYDQGMAEIEAIDKEIDRHVKLTERMAAEPEGVQLMEQPRVSKTAQTPAQSIFAKWLRGGDAALSSEDWASIRAEMRTTSGPEGGYTVQTDVAREVINALKAYGGMREVARVIQTEMGNPMSFPTSDGTAEVGELVAENTEVTAADPTFGTVAVNAYKFSSRTVAVPIELLQDSQIDIEAFVRERLAERLGRITNQYFTIGTGTNQPRGVVTAASAGKIGPTGQTTTVTFDDLVDLVHSVDPAYRALGNVRFMLHDNTLREIRKLKDAQGRPIFVPGFDGLGGSMPDTILGYPVTINNDMPTMAANARSILFGYFGKYIIRDVMQVTMFRFTDSAYTKKGQVGFLAWMRSGGNLLDSNAVKYYQNSAT